VVPFSPVRDIRAAIIPATIGVENEVPLHRARPVNVAWGAGGFGSV
jgi:hypothetical protein